MNLKLKLARLLFTVLRGADRVLPPALLHAALLPAALAMVELERLWPKLAFLDALGGKTVSAPRRARLRLHLNRFLEFLPDRLRGPQWQPRCRIEGLEHLQAACAAGRPVVLAICHFGPFHVLATWLRAFGIPATILLWGKGSYRSRAKRMKDGVLNFPDIPPAIYLDELRRAREMLAAGTVLIVSVDVPSENSTVVDAGKRGVFRLANGAIRLASGSGATLIPCTIADEGRWRFRIELGLPVSAKLVHRPSDYQGASRQLIDALLPAIERDPASYPQEFSQNLRVAQPQSTS